MTSAEIKAALAVLDKAMTSVPHGIAHTVQTRDCTCQACVRSGRR